MKKSLSLLLPAFGLSAFLATISAAPPAVTITTQATLAPNAFGSPSFAAWTANALYAAQFGLSSYGAAGPTQYNVVTNPLPVVDNFVTDFPSWMGVADPTGAFANEYGDRASFTTEINGNGSLISISEMGFYGSSSDPGDALGVGFDYPDDTVDPGDWTYDFADLGTIGIIDNPGGGYTYVTDGPATELVNEIIVVGVGNAYQSLLGDLPPPATDQEILNADAASVAPYDFTGTFTYGDVAPVSGSATLVFVPDSSSGAFDALVLAGIVFAGLSLPKRYRKKLAMIG